jgi:hypothetical protein
MTEPTDQKPPETLVETPSEASSETKDDASATPARDTHFDFEHKVFAISGAFFSTDPAEKKPVLNITLGDLKASLGFTTLRESFGLPEDGHDVKLLDVVAKGLKFVKIIMPGEQIPGELLDGRASWAVEDKHRMVARGRITVQLVSWVTGHEMIVVDVSELEQIVEDPGTKERLKTAFQEIGKKLGIMENAEDTITNMVGSLAQELSYIEALRDRFLHIRTIADNLIKATQIYRTDRGLVSEIARMQGLLKKPLSGYDSIFEQADAQTGEIVGALKSFDTTVHFIRKIRDDLRARLLDWEDLLRLWEATPVEKSQKLEQTLKATYRFLATNFIETKVWERK